MSFSKEMLSRLRRHGYKATPQRLAVLKAISRSQERLTPLAIYHKVRQEHPRIGLVTVYRTLNILTELGLICEVRTGEDTRSYVGSPPQHHDHLICSDCGKVVDFTGCNVAALEDRLVKETGFAIEAHHLEFVGHCRNCQR
jgi:Fur family ferric uptake transcriptional regulator